MFHILTVQSASDEWLTQPCNWQYTINTWSPCGTGIVAAPAKQLLQLAGVQDVHTQWKGLSATMGNFLLPWVPSLYTLCIVPDNVCDLHQITKPTGSSHLISGMKSSLYKEYSEYLQGDNKICWDKGKFGSPGKEEVPYKVSVPKQKRGGQEGSSKKVHWHEGKV